MKTLEALYGRYTSESRGRARMTVIEEAFELRFLTQCLAWIGAIRTFVDVGANVGVYSIHALRSGCPHVIALEPSPDSFSELQRNVALNWPKGHPGLTLVKAAASNQQCKLPFQQRSPLGTGNRVAEAPGVGAIEVEAVRLDDVLGPSGARDCFAKIDVEGHELLVLQGAVRSIQERFALIQLEILEPARRPRVAEQLERQGLDLLFRVGWDHVFLHRDFASVRGRLQESYFDYFSDSARVLHHIAAQRVAGIRNPKWQQKFARVFNGFRGVLPPGGTG